MAGLKTDGVNKNNHSDYINVLRQNQAMVQSAKEHSHEEYRSNSQLEAEEIDTADQVSNPDYYKKHQQRILYQQIQQDMLLC